MPTIVGLSGIALAAGLAWLWVARADATKLLNPFGAFITSTNLRLFNYGTWGQLFSSQLWLDILPVRILTNALGYGWPVLIVTIRFARAESRLTHLALASILLFFVPLAVFTNLHLVHDYYQTANSIFAIVAAALLIAETAAVKKTIVASVLLVVIVAGAVARFGTTQWPQANQPFARHPYYIAAIAVEGSTPVNSALIVFGIDWSSEIPLLRQTQGCGVSWLGKGGSGDEVLRRSGRDHGGLKTASVVDCRPVLFRYYPQLDAIVSAFVEGWAKDSELISGSGPGTCAVYVKRG